MDNNIFISHSSKDVRYVEKIIDLLVDMGIPEKQIFCSSVPGFGIPIGRDIYDYLANEFSRSGVHVIFVLSHNYYRSVACLNEMGAVWALQKEYTTILLPKFDYQEIRGAINLRQISLKLDAEKDEMTERIEEIRRTLSLKLDLAPVVITRWERNRDKFIGEVSSLENSL